MKSKIWETFISWWNGLEQEAKADELADSDCIVTYPENVIADCETYKDKLYIQSTCLPVVESEFGKVQRMLELNSVKSCHMTKIHAIEDRGIWGPSGEVDIRMYCESCWYELQESSWNMRMEEGPSHAEQAQYEMENFVKFFRNWHFGLIEDIDSIIWNNNTCWEPDELMEIFSILKLFVMTNDDVANAFDNHMAQYKSLVDKIKESLE